MRTKLFGVLELCCRRGVLQVIRGRRTTQILFVRQISLAGQHFAETVATVTTRVLATLLGGLLVYVYSFPKSNTDCGLQIIGHPPCSTEFRTWKSGAFSRQYEVVAYLWISEADRLPTQESASAPAVYAAPRHTPLFH